MARPTKTISGNNKFKSSTEPIEKINSNDSKPLKEDSTPFYSKMVHILKLKHPEIDFGTGVEYNNNANNDVVTIHSNDSEDDELLAAAMCDDDGNENDKVCCPPKARDPTHEGFKIDGEEGDTEGESDGGPEIELELGFPHDHQWFLSLNHHSNGLMAVSIDPQPNLPIRNWDNWQEPPVADPKVGVNGLLFGLPPPAKMLRGDKSFNDNGPGKKSRAKTPRAKKVNNSRSVLTSSATGTPSVDIDGDIELNTDDIELNLGDNGCFGNGGVDSIDPSRNNSSEDLSAKYTSGATTTERATPIGSRTPLAIKAEQLLSKQSQRENFMHSLITHLSEGLTKPSDERRGIIEETLVSKPRPDLEISTPSSPTAQRDKKDEKDVIVITPVKIKEEKNKSISTAANTATSGSPCSGTEKKRKRIKFSSPKKPRENPFGFGAGPDLSGCPRSKTNNNQTYDDPTKHNDDTCAVCGGIGRFLCCESCPKSFHFTCVDPPLDENSLPEGDWYCQECASRGNVPVISSFQSPVSPSIENNKFFGLLFYQLTRRNPIQFVLPKRIIERFDGISVGKFGEYQDNDLKLANNSIQRTPSQSVNGDGDSNRIYDKTGAALFCYRCGDSAIHGKIMTQCDYCPLAWHLDCLNPPLSTVKTLGKKWKCPNHSDIGFKKLRRPKKAKIVDVDLKRGFRNDGNIEILDNDDEMQPPLSSLPIYTSSESSILSTSSLLASRRPLNWNSATHINDDSLECESLVVKGVTYLLLDPPFKMDVFNSMVNYDLNHSLINDVTRAKWEMNPTLKVLDELVVRDIKQRECVRNLAYLKTDNGKMLDTPRDYECFNVLIQAASEARQQQRQQELEERNKRPNPVKKQTRSSRPASMRGNNRRYSSQNSTAENSPSKSMDINLPDSYFDQVLPSEVGELSAIKKLMQLKGKDALLEFLNDDI